MSVSGIGHALKRLGVIYKKPLKHPKADSVKRSAYYEKIKEFEDQSPPLVFLDESGFVHERPGTHNYAPKGQRCLGTHD